jgi:hypothetical protein
MLASAVAAVTAPALLIAQEGATVAQGAADAAAAQPWQLAIIPVLTPLIIAGVKLLMPKIPTVVLPFLAPVLGAAIDLIAHFATGANLNVWLSAGLGLAGVGLREIVDQSKQSISSTPPADGGGAQPA